MKQLFIKACLSNDEDILFNTFSEQQLESKGKYLIGPNCRFCHKPDIDDVHFTYWSACWSPCHKVCKAVGSKTESYECQLIDADCNDCKHFIRGKKSAQKGSSYGKCGKTGESATAHSNYASGHECFEHRKEALV